MKCEAFLKSKIENDPWTSCQIRLFSGKEGVQI